MTAGIWSAAGELPTSNVATQHAAATLTDGRVLVAGGGDAGLNAFGTATLFDPDTLTWTEGGSLAESRRLHTLTLLANDTVPLHGAVLAAGGIPGAYRYPPPATASAELFDGGKWRSTGRLADARFDHSATLLADGTVLVAGGETSRSAGSTRSLASVERYDPGSESWTRVAPMTDPRSGHQAVLLADDRVLVTGGFVSNGAGSFVSLAFCEIYDPTADRWAMTGSLRTARAGHQSTLLSDGTVLTTGGATYGLVLGPIFDGHSHASTERYDPATGGWYPAEPMPAGRSRHQAISLEDGRLLVLGGTDEASVMSGFGNAVLYDPDSRFWTPTPAMIAGRYASTAVRRPDGRVLVIGGVGQAALATATGQGMELVSIAELFSPSGVPPEVKPPSDVELDAWMREAEAWSKQADEHHKAGRHPESVDCEQKALDLFTKVRKWRPIITRRWAYSSLFLGVYLQAAGRHADAVKSATRAVEGYETTGDKPLIAWAYGNLGTILNRASRPAEAVAAQQRARELYQQLTSTDPAYRPLWAGTCVFLAAYLSTVGRHDEAIAVGIESVELYRQAGDQYRVGWAYGNLASRYQAAKRWVDACDAQRSCRDIYRTLSQTDPAYRASLAQTSVVFAGLLIHVPLYDEAVAVARDGVDLYRELNDQPQLAWALSTLRATYRVANRHEEAVVPAQEARDIYHTLAQANPAYRALLAREAMELAMCLDTLRKRPEALASAREAVAVYEALAQEDPAKYTPSLTAARELVRRLENAG
ncbi:kelch repeat-containing protein [Kribbella sp. NPDC056951]|uniref:kelch repeat-containing protein n=1 Tax=Kribbella sp. NPDC056951 TaxID=3345978 RepID=UPI003641B20D